MAGAGFYFWELLFLRIENPYNSLRQIANLPQRQAQSVKCQVSCVIKEFSDSLSLSKRKMGKSFTAFYPWMWKCALRMRKYVIFRIEYDYFTYI
jgi:hypothetical protein